MKAKQHRWKETPCFSRAEATRFWLEALARESGWPRPSRGWSVSHWNWAGHKQASPQQGSLSVDKRPFKAPKLRPLEDKPLWGHAWGKSILRENIEKGH